MIPYLEEDGSVVFPDMKELEKLPYLKV